MRKRKTKLLKQTALIPFTPSLRTLPEQELKAPKMRVSGHYIDLKTKYTKPDSNQISIFDTLLPETKEKLEESNITTIVEGIKLTPTQEKMINTLLSLLHKKSNTKINEKNKPEEPERFYRGNLTPDKAEYGGVLFTVPTLSTTQHEVCTEYTGSKDYSGKEIKDILNLLKSIEDSKFLIKYKAKRFVKNGKKVEELIDRIEEYQPLLKVTKYYKGLTIKEDEALDKNENFRNNRGEMIFKFNPVFVHQLDTKFIIYPTDINKRTEIASGGTHRVTEAIIRLRDTLMRRLSHNEYSYTVDEERLPYILGLDNYIKESRRKLIKDRIEDSIKAVINLGLVLEVKKVQGKQYQPQYLFVLNPNFNK